MSVWVGQRPSMPGPDLMKAAQFKLIQQFSGKSPSPSAWGEDSLGMSSGWLSRSDSRRPCSAPRARPSSATGQTPSQSSGPVRRPMSARSGTRPVSVVPGAWANTHAATSNSRDLAHAAPSTFARDRKRPQSQLATKVEQEESSGVLGVFGVTHPATVGVPVGGGFKVAMSISGSEKSRDSTELQRIKEAITKINERLEHEHMCQPKSKEEEELLRRHIQSSDPQQMLLAKARMYELFTTKQERLINESLKCVLPHRTADSRLPLLALVDKTIEQHEALREAEVRIREQASELQGLLGSGKTDAETVRMLRHTLTQAVEEKTSMEEKIASLSDQLDQQHAAAQAQLDQQRDELTEQFTQAKNEANCTECTRRELELHRSQVELDAALNAIREIGADKQSHAERNRDLSQQLRDVSDEMRRLQTNCHNAFIQRDALQSKYDSAKLRLVELQQQLDIERQAASTRPEPKVQEPAAAAAAAAHSAETLKQLQAEVAMLHKEKERLTKALDSSRQSGAQIQKELATAKEAIVPKERELTRLRGEIETIKGLADRDKKALEEQRKAMAAERESLAKDVAEAKKRANENDKDASLAEKEKKALEAQIIDLTKKLEKAEKARQLAEAQAKKLEATTSEQKQNSQLQGQMAGLRDSNQSLKQENENLKKQIELAVKRGEAEARKLKNQLESQNEELFQERENHLRTKLDLEDSNKKLQHDRDDLQLQIKGLQARATDAARGPSIGNNVEKKIASSAAPAKEAEDSVPLSEVTNLKSRYEEKLKLSEKEKEAMRKENVDRYKAITDKFAEEKERLERKVNTLMDRCELLEKRVAESAQASQANNQSDSEYKKRMLELYDQRLAELETVKQQYEDQIDKNDAKKKKGPKAASKR